MGLLPWLIGQAVPGKTIRDVHYDAPIVVEIGRDDDAAFTDTTLVPVQASAGGKLVQGRVILCSSSILVKGKYVIAKFYAPEEDVGWVQPTRRKFVNEMVNLNK